VDLIPRFTTRCERDDLKGLPTGIADGIQRKVQNRIDTESIESGDRYLSVPTPKMFTEHQGAFRAVTWYDEQTETVWICAVGRHYPDDRDPRDLYQVARQLANDERLLPNRGDYVKREAVQLRADVERGQGDPQEIRRTVDAKGEARALLFGMPVWLTRIDDNFYELRVEQATSTQTIGLALGALFPDQEDVEWTTPERAGDGQLYVSVFVLVGK
jgi:hypothetical protein